MRVPEPEKAKAVVASSQAISPSEEPTARVLSPSRRKKARKPAATDATEIWDGLVTAPSQTETAISESLLYPLWGATGVALLLFLPPLLWFTTLPFVTAVQVWSAGQSLFGIGVLFLLLPASIGLSAVSGYTLLFLGRVLASSAIGERHHPRWPDWDLTSIVFGLGRVWTSSFMTAPYSNALIW